MVIYLAPGKDAQLDADMARLAGRPEVMVTTISLGGRTVKRVLRYLSLQACTALVLPDDYHRHNQLMEDVKVCAYHMGMDVMPLTRYLLKNPAQPASAPAHANAGDAAARVALPTGVG